MPKKTVPSQARVPLIILSRVAAISLLVAVLVWGFETMMEIDKREAAETAWLENQFWLDLANLGNAPYGGEKLVDEIQDNLKPLPETADATTVLQALQNIEFSQDQVQDMPRNLRTPIFREHSLVGGSTYFTLSSEGLVDVYEVVRSGPEGHLQPVDLTALRIDGNELNRQFSLMFGVLFVGVPLVLLMIITFSIRQ